MPIRRAGANPLLQIEEIRRPKDLPAAQPRPVRCTKMRRSVVNSADVEAARARGISAVSGDRPVRRQRDRRRTGRRRGRHSATHATPCVARGGSDQGGQGGEQTQRRQGADNQDPMPGAACAGSAVVVAGAGHPAPSAHIPSKLDPHARMRRQRASIESAASGHGEVTTSETARRSGVEAPDGLCR